MGENYIFVQGVCKLRNHMKKFYYLLPILLLALVGCQPNKINEGEVEYAITYPNADISPFMEAILPKTMTITFLGTKTKTRISRGEIFSTEIISDEADRTIEMRLDFGDKLYYTVLTADDIDKMISSQPAYKIKSLTTVDSIAGMFAQSYRIDYSGDTLPRANAWFTEDLAPQNAYWYTPYSSVAGFPLVYDAERYGVMMHVIASKIDKREVLESEFERDPALKEVTFEQYESEVQELFDVLMN